MVARAEKLTPKVLLGSPRRGPATVNHGGTLAFYSVSTYSFEERKTTEEIHVMDIKSGHSKLFTNDPDAHDAVWLGDGTNAIMWLKSGAKSITSLMIGDGDLPEKASYTADVILAPFKDLKVAKLHDGDIACVMSGLATPSGSLYNEETADKPASTARVYDTLLVRFWDRYVTPEKNTLWYSKLAKTNGKYSLAAPVHNALKGTGFECPILDISGSATGQFDISTSGLVLVASDPDKIPWLDGRRQAYYIPLTTFTEDEAPKPRILTTPGLNGNSSSPRFSPCAKHIIFLKSPEIDLEGNNVMLIQDCGKSLDAVKVLGSGSGQPWSLDPSSLEWTRDGKGLFLTASDCGRIKLFVLPFTKNLYLAPRPLTKEGAVQAFQELGESGQVFVSASTLVESSKYYTVDMVSAKTSSISTSLREGSKVGISRSQVSEMYFEGAGDYCVHAWVTKPSFFDETKKYPLAMFLHGGPKDAWHDAWSTRWNPAAWAEQGYVVVSPNFSGSTGFGLDFTESINGEWGGRPYQDIVNCFEYVEKHMPFVDTENAIAAGGSYGGYMACWIQGNPLGRKFKAIVSHDCVFNTQNLIAGDIFGGTHDFKGPMYAWSNYEMLQKWNPARPDLLAEWATPMLVIHSDRDYRCVIADGMAAFGVLQAKGVPSKYLNFPDENHWVLKPENSLVWHNTVFDWINKYSGVGKKASEEKQTQAPSCLRCPYCDETYASESTGEYRGHVKKHVMEFRESVMVKATDEEMSEIESVIDEVRHCVV